MVRLGPQNGYKKAGVLKVILKTAKAHLNRVVMLICEIPAFRQDLHRYLTNIHSVGTLFACAKNVTRGKLDTI